ncbi:MAG: membrane protein insertion efficiency factor YidD [Anaerolineales bacterium]|nr:membrane protein insertion efficiency factor YidD [Anaerolineales bacterium]
MTEDSTVFESASSEPLLSEIPLRLTNLPRLLGMALIRGYQMTLAHLVPADTCRFTPTCSHYGYQAVAKHGLIKGSLLGAWRILRCQPFSKGGYDPVP